MSYQGSVPKKGVKGQKAWERESWSGPNESHSLVGSLVKCTFRSTKTSQHISVQGWELGQRSHAYATQIIPVLVTVFTAMSYRWIASIQIPHPLQMHSNSTSPSPGRPLHHMQHFSLVTYTEDSTCPGHSYKRHTKCPGLADQSWPHCLLL